MIFTSLSFQYFWKQTHAHLYSKSCTIICNWAFVVISSINRCTCNRNSLKITTCISWLSVSTCTHTKAHFHLSPESAEPTGTIFTKVPSLQHPLHGSGLVLCKQAHYLCTPVWRTTNRVPIGQLSHPSCIMHDLALLSTLGHLTFEWVVYVGVSLSFSLLIISLYFGELV